MAGVQPTGAAASAVSAQLNPQQNLAMCPMSSKWDHPGVLFSAALVGVFWYRAGVSLYNFQKGSTNTELQIQSLAQKVSAARTASDIEQVSFELQRAEQTSQRTFQMRRRPPLDHEFDLMSVETSDDEVATIAGDGDAAAPAGAVQSWREATAPPAAALASGNFSRDAFQRGEHAQADDQRRRAAAGGADRPRRAAAGGANQPRRTAGGADQPADLSGRHFDELHHKLRAVRQNAIPRITVEKADQWKTACTDLTVAVGITAMFMVI